MELPGSVFIRYATQLQHLLTIHDKASVQIKQLGK